MNKKIKASIAAILLAAAAPLLAACTSTASPTPSAAEPASGTSEAAETLTLNDGWAKSASADGMTGVFGVLENHSDTDIEILRVESDAADLIELHEVTAEGVMQEIAGEVIVPAAGTRELAPGADHIMLMQLQHDLLAGDEVTFTVFYTVNDEQQSATFTVFVKDYSGANEDYAPGHGEHSEHSEHDEDHAAHADTESEQADDEHGSH